MDRTVSISKGVFVFNTEKIHKSPKKHSKSQPTTNIFADNLWYKSYKTTWTDLQHKLEILHNNMFSNMLANLVLFVKKSYDDKVDEIPTAALLTGINMPDHEEQFKALAREIRMQVTPHVACLNSLSCQSVKHIVENVVDAFVNKVASDEFFEEEDDERSKIKKINCNMPVLSAWYKDLYKRNKKRGKTRVNPLVVIITEVEGFDQKALQDFILISSSYLNELPIVLIFGIATSLSTLHKILPYQVSCKINIKVFSSQPSTVYLNSVLEHVFFAQNCYFRLGGKVFSLLTDIFLFYDLSVTGFIRNFKYALLEHFSSGNATALCTNPKYARQLLEDFKKEDFEAVRHLLSFRKFVENHPPEERIKLLTDDEFFKKKLVKELNNFHEYLYMFHVFLNVLNILVRDLPTAPLGKHVREIYALAARSPITATEEYKEALQLLKFQSRFELSAKVSKIANYLEEKLREPTKLEHNLEAYMAQLNVFVNNLQTVSDNVTEAQPKENEANFTDQMGRQKLKNKLLENMKSKPQNRYETLRSELLDFFSSSFEEYLRPPTTNYFHEIFVFDDISIQSHIIGSHRAAIHTALNDPHDYLQCSCCEIPNEAVILRSMPDICVAYKLHLECGKLINLYDWLQSFLSVVDPIGADEDDEKRVVKPELQARFTQAIAELEYLGFVKSSKRKADHVMRLTWGG